VRLKPSWSLVEIKLMTLMTLKEGDVVDNHDDLECKAECRR